MRNTIIFNYFAAVVQTSGDAKRELESSSKWGPCLNLYGTGYTKVNPYECVGVFNPQLGVV